MIGDIVTGRQTKCKNLEKCFDSDNEVERTVISGAAFRILPLVEFGMMRSAF
jgi:hypothetical protein